MFAGYHIESITNGVHAATWVAAPFQDLFDRRVPTWREDNFTLRGVLAIPLADVWTAHMTAKRQLLHYVNREANAGFDHDVLTIGFARRATAYKRADLLLSDVARLQRIGAERGRLQIIYAGKAHPRDESGKDLIRRIVAASRQLATKTVRVIYLDNYDLELAKLMTAGVDVWLNTPRRPLEASGTSGMKAALNGVPSLSILDGWWIEGHIEGVTGWSIGEDGHQAQTATDAQDAEALYDKLATSVVPTFYDERQKFIDIMRHAIALNGSFFNTQRMIQQYVLKAYSGWSS
jgi:starch phosphorylase